MALLDRLIRDARKAMRARGHIPLPAERAVSFSAASIQCAKCRMGVGVICKPLPNEVQIAGQAISMNCNVATKPMYEKRGDKYHFLTPSERKWPNEIRMDAVMGC